MAGRSPQLILHHFPGGVEWQLVEELNIAWRFESGHPLTAPADQILFGDSRFRISGRHHERLAHLAEPLVYYRVGDGAYARRGGTDLLRSEIALQRRFRRLGITSRTEFVRNVAVRGGYRLVPERVRKVAYRRLLANRSDASRG